MERPTCGTCPYFDRGKEIKSVGACRRHAPHTFNIKDISECDNSIDEDDDEYPCWPKVAECDWCGEHPDFPAWIREQRRTRATPCIEDDPDVIRFDELWVTVQKAFHKLGVRTWADVADLTESRLMELERFGQSSLNMVKAELRIRGLQLRRSPDDTTRQVANS